jgi:hypothetical protein
MNNVILFFAEKNPSSVVVGIQFWTMPFKPAYHNERGQTSVLSANKIVKTPITCRATLLNQPIQGSFRPNRHFFTYNHDNSPN